MSIQAILTEIISILNSRRIPYMLSGSVAFNFYSVPRATRDIDLVAELKPEDAAKLISSIRGHYYFNEETINEEIRRKGFFNIIHYTSSFKIDFILLKNTEFELLKFSRRKNIDFEGLAISIITREDLILSKLMWIQQFESDLQKSDIRLLIDFPELDLEYIHNWVRKLGLKTYDIKI
jgi:hypothetical protein